MKLYKISELAEKAGVTRRTIHYYIQRGLLPPSEGSGVNSVYNDGHLFRLKLIKALQERYLPLDHIREMIIGLSDDEVIDKLENLPDKDELVSMSSKDEPCEYKPAMAVGREYIHVDLGKGMELTFPKELLDEQEQAVRAIIQYAQKLI